MLAPREAPGRPALAAAPEAAARARRGAGARAARTPSRCSQSTRPAFSKTAVHRRRPRLQPLVRRGHEWPDWTYHHRRRHHRIRRADRERPAVRYRRGRRRQPLVHGLLQQQDFWRITTAGVFTDFSTPTQNRPTRITDGPDGNVWFIEPDLHLVARITPAGTIAEFPLLTGRGPQDVVSGPDGNLIVEGNQVDRMTPAGAVTPFPMPTVDFEPSLLTVGPDGNLWITEPTLSRIARMMLTGDDRVHVADAQPRHSRHRQGTGWQHLVRRVLQRDCARHAGRCDPGIHVAPDPPAPPLPGVVAGPDGNVWFTDYNRGMIGRIIP